MWQKSTVVRVLSATSTRQRPEVGNPNEPRVFIAVDHISNVLGTGHSMMAHALNHYLQAFRRNRDPVVEEQLLCQMERVLPVVHTDYLYLCYLTVCKMSSRRRLRLFNRLPSLDV